MCLILFSYDEHPKYRLILAANRDEFYERPTEPAAYWDEYPGLIAGKDVKAGGTWMGITPALRFAAITNYRDPAAEKKEAPSRGHLVLDYLKEEMSPESYLHQLKTHAHAYNGYNLLVGDKSGLWYFSNKERVVRSVHAGVHGLSNALLNTSWPKVEKGKAALANLAGQQDVDAQQLLALLADPAQAPDETLPNTGVPLDWERRLSSMFIQSPNYGTRASTALLIDYEGNVSFVERTIQTTSEQLLVGADAEGRNASFDQVTYAFKAH